MKKNPSSILTFCCKHLSSLAYFTSTYRNAIVLTSKNRLTLSELIKGDNQTFKGR